MPDEQPPTPETPQPEPPESGGGAGAVEGRQASAKASARIATFTQQPGEGSEQLQERFIDEVLVPVIEWVVLPDARDLVAEMTAGLERGLPEAPQAGSWGVRAASIVERMGRLLGEVQRAAGGTLGPVGGFAMAEIAHNCPKFLHMFVVPECRTLAQALERGDAEAAEDSRQALLREMGGAGVLPAPERFRILLENYFITKTAFRRRFRDAEQGIALSGHFNAVAAQVERRMEGSVRDVLRIEQHSYEIECATNIPEEQYGQELIPRAGLVVEVIAELITNALKVMEKAGRGSKLLVSIILRKDGSLLLRVRDDGPGIGDRDPEELFAAGETTTQRFGGTGMGLTYLRQNIERHFQGFLTGKKNADRDGSPGMTFTCILPPAGGWPEKSE